MVTNTCFHQILDETFTKYLARFKLLQEENISDVISNSFPRSTTHTISSQQELKPKRLIKHIMHLGHKKVHLVKIGETNLLKLQKLRLLLIHATFLNKEFHVYQQVGGKFCV